MQNPFNQQTKRFSLYFFIFFFIFGINATEVLAQSAARKSIDAMFAACNKVQTLTFKMLKYERMGAKTTEATTAIKYRKSPLSIYIYGFTPTKGIEILFNKGQNNNEAYVNPGGFPYVTLSLSPLGKLMRSDNHFTIYDVGFETLAANLRHTIAGLGARFDECFKLEGTVNWRAYNCEKLVLTNDDYRWINYTVPKTETLEVIAKGLHLSSYAIKERNNLSGFGSVKGGTVLQIPSAFAKKVVLYIDKITHLPVYQELNDDKGRFASYEFYDLKLNAALTNEDFSKDNKAYNF